MKKLNCYLSQAITLLRQFDQSEVAQYLEYYEHIEKCLKKNHKVNIFHPIKEEKKQKPDEIYWMDLNEVDKADFLVAEISVVSWGVGQELTYAIMKGKPILALYNNKSRFKLSEMITGAGLRIRTYNGKSKEWKEQIARHIAGFMPEVKQYFYLRERVCAKPL
ncbi:MAG: nucleoside 2-deoxyribosyltransferase [Pseudomonadota bacterium]